MAISTNTIQDNYILDELNESIADLDIKDFLITNEYKFKDSEDIENNCGIIKSLDKPKQGASLNSVAKKGVAQNLDSFMINLDQVYKSELDNNQVWEEMRDEQESLEEKKYILNLNAKVFNPIKVQPDSESSKVNILNINSFAFKPLKIGIQTESANYLTLNETQDLKNKKLFKAKNLTVSKLEDYSVFETAVENTGVDKNDLDISTSSAKIQEFSVLNNKEESSSFLQENNINPTDNEAYQVHNLLNFF